MNRIKFTHLWDKLTEPEFTTIRSWNPDKEKYYKSLKGQKFQVLKVKTQFSFYPEYTICHAYLSAVQVMDPKEIDINLLRRDVTINGVVNKEWYGKILNMNRVILLTFQSPSFYWIIIKEGE